MHRFHCLYVDVLCSFFPSPKFVSDISFTIIFTICDGSYSSETLIFIPLIIVIRLLGKEHKSSSKRMKMNQYL